MTDANQVTYDDAYAQAWLAFAESGKDTPRLEHIVPYIAGVFQGLPREGLSRPASVLDVGCGWGMALDILMEQRPDASYVGIDATPALLEYAKKKAERNYEHYQTLFVQGSLPHAVGFEDNYFDLVLCSMTLHCVGEVDQAVAALFRKSKERVVIVDFADAAEKLLRASFEPGYVDNGHYLSGIYNLALGIQVHAEAFVRNEKKIARQIGYHADFAMTRLGDLFVAYDCVKKK
jgi:SAM-dependent methyltransferase